MLDRDRTAGRSLVATTLTVVLVTVGLATPAPAGAAVSRAELALRWAPIHYQDVDVTGSHALGGRSDYLTRVDFDGDLNGRNNWDNAARSDASFAAHAYYSVLETSTHGYITYLFFHPRDWTDHPFFETEHENDGEGVLFAVERDGSTYGVLRSAVTVAHTNFYLPLGFLPFVLAKARRMKRLLKSGGTAIGTVTAVADTGITVNRNPRVRLTLRIEPQDGSAPFDGEKTVTMSRLDPARPGRCYPVWYDRDDPAVFAIGTTVQPHASVEVRRLFALAERQELQGRHRFAGTPTAAPAAAGDLIDDLARLHELRRSGALTDAEFDTMKARIIGRG